ncbi:MAG: rod shape-determining protein, partial [Gammaproteobacteria bacterium]
MFSRTFYIRIEADRIRVDSPGVERGFDDAAIVAIQTEASGKKVIAAVGREAEAMSRSPGINLVRPFAHPRIVVGDFTVAEKLVQHAVRTFVRAQPLFFIRPMVRVVLHPKRALEGGLTQVEHRALRELAEQAGA